MVREWRHARLSFVTIPSTVPLQVFVVFVSLSEIDRIAFDKDFLQVDYAQLDTQMT